MIKPIFVIGSPRSGVTLLEIILGMHPELAWISTIQDKMPNVLSISLANRIHDVPIIGKHLYNFASQDNNKLHLMFPVEPWNFLNSAIPGFLKGADKWFDCPPKASDMTSVESLSARKVLNRLARYHGKERFFTSFGDFPRIGYLRRAFPDALFVHLVRDGRAVAESYYRCNETGTYESWNERNRWPSNMPEEWRKGFLEKNFNLFGLSVYRWMYYCHLCWEEASELTTNCYLQIAYEDIVADPLSAVDRILQFAELKRSSKLEWFLEKTPPINCNRKWRESLSTDQLNQFFDIVQEERFLALLNDNV